MQFTDTQKEKLRADVHKKCGLYLYETELDALLNVIERHQEKAAGDAKQEGIKKVARHANPEWVKRYYECLMAVAKTRHTFSADDVCAMMQTAYPKVRTHDNRAAGSVFMQALRDGLCSPTPNYIPTAQKKSHGSPQRVWISLHS